MSLFSKLFGGGSGSSDATKPQPVTHQGFAITANPSKEGGRFRVGATITKELGGEVKTHTLIRADTLEDMDTAIEVSIRKAKQMIDEQGERIFG